MNILDFYVIDATGKRYNIVPADNEPSLQRTDTAGLQTSYESQRSLSFGELFRQKRTEENLTQASVSQISGLKQPNISFMENEKRTPRPETQQLLVSAWERLSGKKWRT